MPTGQVTSPVVSYLGELFQTGKRPNTTLRLLGGFQGGVQIASAREFPVGVFYSLRTPSQPARLEGAAAPTAEHRTLTQSTNVVQIFQEKVSLSYLAQSDNTVSGVVPIPTANAHGSVINPRSEEFQVMAALQTVAQDANYSFLRGTYANPADPAGTALRTRGIHTAITTNSLVKTGDTGVTAAMYRAYVESLLALIIQQSGYNIDDTWTLVAGVTEFSNVCAAYEAKGTIFISSEQEVVGVKVRKIVTKWGTLNLALEPDMPDLYFDIINFGMCGIVGLPVPKKGVLFEEPLYKQGSSDETQIYGQMGVDHGAEYFHGKCLVATGIAL